MEQIDVNISILYDEDKREVIQAEIRGEHTLGEISAIVAGLKEIVKSFGYKLTKNEIR